MYNKLTWLISKNYRINWYLDSLPAGIAKTIIKGDNIPESGIPESFKVLLKELQSLGLDVRVLRADNTEVEIGETIDYGETDLHSIIEGDRRYEPDESFGEHGFSQQEFEGGELVDVEEDVYEDTFDALDSMEVDYSEMLEEE
jgi:DNA-directed RNA polymerase subunit beta